MVVSRASAKSREAMRDTSVPSSSLLVPLSSFFVVQIESVPTMSSVRLTPASLCTASDISMGTPSPLVSGTKHEPPAIQFSMSERQLMSSL